MIRNNIFTTKCLQGYFIFLFPIKESKKDFHGSNDHCCSTGKDVDGAHGHSHGSDEKTQSKTDLLFTNQTDTNGKCQSSSSLNKSDGDSSMFHFDYVSE